jgi:isocitrate dehydrogenase kinase/phosphatase
MIEGFNKHYRIFRETSRRAKESYEAADWQGQLSAVRDRVQFYDDRVNETVQRLHEEFDADSIDDATWQAAKLQFIGLLINHKQPELAETFFNSVTTKILHRDYFNNDLLFARPAISTDYIESFPPTYSSYYPADEGLRSTIRRIVEDFDWQRPFEDLDRDVDYVMRTVAGPPLARGRRWRSTARSRCCTRPSTATRPPTSSARPSTATRKPLRDRSAPRQLGHALPRHHPARPTWRISLLFSLSRAYFLVDMEVPSGYVQFLRSIMPNKPRSELYTMLGLGKQGKTNFFRDLVAHLRHSNDQFIEAPGIRGLVMLVFTLPSYPYVFKIIKDVFGSSKNMDRATVKRKYLLVRQVDRVGRMADTLEFSNVALPRSRFHPDLIAQLRHARPVRDRGGRRQPGHQAPLHRAPHDAAQPLPRQGHRSAGRPRRARIRPGHQRAGHRQHLPRRHAVEELRRHPLRPRRVLRLRRDRVHDRLQLPQDPASAQRRGRDVQRALVFGRADGRLPGRIRHLPARPAQDPQGLPEAPPPTARRPKFWQDAQQKIRDGYVEDFYPYPAELRFCNAFADEAPASSGQAAAPPF